MNTLLMASHWLIISPLCVGLFAGVFGHFFPKIVSQLATIVGIGCAFVAALVLFNGIVLQHVPAFEVSYYTWAISQGLTIPIACLIDPLSVMMAVIVTFVSLCVHIYSIGYMKDDKSNPRFFSYMSVFTFAMLALVLANNFLLLFFGWEGVGLVSYLLIGFWFDRPSANAASLKAFLVNRVADCAFLVGIATVYAYFHSLDYDVIFAHIDQVTHLSISIWPGTSWSVISVMGILLFIGAMGKSAQIPLHVWLPESMEGPTPISALIHAATMVTAGIYLVARLSPLYEQSATALSVVLFIGATQALFMGLIGMVQTDIKRVVAYSTLSQLGYMMAGLGCSAFDAGLFHLFTHACFKALLFLSAGAIIIAMHHEQDIRHMGGLARKMPITYVCFLIGALALAAIPPTSGFYSKDSILAALQQTPGVNAQYAYACLLAGVFVTAFYIFRVFFKVFHGQPCHHEVHETSPVMWWPLVILAIAALCLGAVCIRPLLIDTNSWFGHTLMVLPQHQHLALFVKDFPGVIGMALEALSHTPFWLGLAGILTAWLGYVKYPQFPVWLTARLSWLHHILVHEYGFNAFNQIVFVNGSLKMAQFFAHRIDEQCIDGVMVNGSGRLMHALSVFAKRLQSGYVYQYALVMVLSLLGLIVWQLFIKD